MKMHKWSDVKKRLKVPASKVREIEQEIEAEVLEVNLRQLRDLTGMTQVEVAAKLKAAQSQLSQIENQSDHKLSTLRRYVHALGGELKVQAIVNGKTVELLV